MTAVMLKPTWPGTFRRSVRDDKGQVLEVLEFQLGVPVELDEQQLAAVKDDVGKSLCLSQLTPDGFPVGKPDWAATEAFVKGEPPASPAAGPPPHQAAAELPPPSGETTEPPRGKPPRGKRK